MSQAGPEPQRSDAPRGKLVLELCRCERPLPRERAERKWAVTTYCERCGLQLPLAWR